MRRTFWTASHFYPNLFSVFRRKFKEYRELYKKKLRGCDGEEWKELLSHIQVRTFWETQATKGGYTMHCKTVHYLISNMHTSICPSVRPFMFDRLSVSSFRRLFFPSFVHSFVPSPVCSFIHSFIHPFIQTSFIRLFLHPFARPFVHPSLHSCVHFFGAVLGRRPGHPKPTDRQAVR